jgi:hypothetical protein
MGYVWAVIVSVILLLIIYGIVNSKIRERRNRKLTKELLPEVQDHIKSNQLYDVYLSCGRSFLGVKFIGFSKTPDGNSDSLPFPLQSWVILEDANGKRSYIKPTSLRFYQNH